MSSEFIAYSTPSSTAAYSQYFESLTLRAAADLALNYPPILAPGSLVSFVFHSDEPCTAPSNLIPPGEAVPCDADLWPIVQNMKTEYA